MSRDLTNNGSPPAGSYPTTVDQLLMTTVRKHASDLHLVVGSPPVIRIYGELTTLGLPKLTPAALEELLFTLLEPYQRKKLDEEWELDFSYSISGVSRFRGNVMRQRGSLSADFRVIPYEAPTFEELGLPEQIKDLCTLPRGLVLVTGPTGSGKSTTLAAMIDYINRTRGVNIVSVEEPIEFLHHHKRALIQQREVGSDTHSFAAALHHVLRHDPDVILIGEMRDLESISIALTAAETGHLVLSTLHTQTAPLTINRIVDVFQQNMRSQVRIQLSDTLQAVISQQLLPRSDQEGRVLATELMLATSAIRNLIREEREHQIYSCIQTGQAAGMHTMDQSLARLCLLGKISRETAFNNCVDQKELKRLLESGAMSAKKLVGL